MGGRHPAEEPLALEGVLVMFACVSVEWGKGMNSDILTHMFCITFLTPLAAVYP